MKKAILSLVAVLLAAAAFLLTPMQIFADANTKNYIEDIIIVSTTNVYNAKTLAGSDYIVLDTPIYDDGYPDSGERMKKSWICYKITHDPSKAITDIKALNMNAPWDYDTYNQHLAEIKANVAEEADALAAAVYEFQNNYGEELPKAEYVYEVLQYLYDDKSKSRLGDLFLDLDFEDEKRDAKGVLVNILLMSNAQCVNVIYNALTLACSETNENSFLDIISEAGFNASNYAKETKYASMAQDIIDTIDVTQKELKKYESSLNHEEANVFPVPKNSEMKAAYDTVQKMMSDDKTGAGVFDRYIELVAGAELAALNPSERRMLIETGLANVAWYAMDSEYFTSLKDVYDYMPTVVSMFRDKTITADEYNKKIDQAIDNHQKASEDLPEYLKKYLTFYYFDAASYTDHLLDIAENKTGKQLSEILHGCAYHGYDNRYESLYDLVMAHDMTVPESEREGEYELSDFYPIIAQLSEGQRGMLKTGIMNLILSVEVDETEYEKSFEILKETIKELASGECRTPDVNAEDPCYSIYDNTDESLFVEDSGVAMMKSAIDCQKEYSYKNAYGEIFRNLGIFGGATAAAAGVTAVVSKFVASSAQKTVLSFEKMALDAVTAERLSMGLPEASFAEYGASRWTLCHQGLNEANMTLYEAANARAAIAQTVSKVFNYVFAVIMIALIVVMTVFAIMSIWVKVGSNDYLGIPRAICAERDICTYTVNLNGEISVDRKAKGLVYYYGVKNPRLTEKEGRMYADLYVDPGVDPSGNDLTKYQVADIGNWSQTSTERQWIALYTTKDISVGQPILADTLSIDGRDWVANVNTVSVFDETKPCNMHYYLVGATAGKYLHYENDKTYNPYRNAEDKVNRNNTAASVFTEPSSYVIGAAGLVIGLGAGCGITVLAQKGKKKKHDNE